LEHSKTTSLLQSAYSDDQIGPFKNFHQLVEDALAIVGSGLEVLLQYALRFADRFQSQLLICHRLSPIRCGASGGEGQIKPFFGDIPSIFVSILEPSR
jgi:hypothetical protein